MGFKFEKLSVLVIEDNMPMSKLIASVLKTLGIGTIYDASDGESGFSKFCAKRPDIVLVDWHMEPVSGIEVVKRIRRHPSSPDKMVPIIMMTGYSAMARVEEARDSGITEYLVKPFTANDLAKRIAHVINKPRDFVDTGNFFGPDRRRRADPNYKGPERRESKPLY